MFLQTPPVPPAPQRPAVAGQAQQLPGRDQAQRPPVVGKGSLSGTVVSESGQTLKGARVSLSGGAVGRTVTTDATGAFVFDKLPEGRYSLSATRPRYLAGSYGQKKPERAGNQVPLADGEQVKNLTVTLFSAGVITGTVYGDDGEPVQNAQVRALRSSMRTGVRRLQPSNSGQTDDRGMYRLYGLMPGEYVVSAVSNQNDQGLQWTAEMSIAIERAGGAIQFQNGLLTMANGETMEVPAPVTFAPTFYPGTTMPGSASAVTVRGGEERGGIDISMQKVQTATVSGTVISRLAAPPESINIQMQPVDEAAQGIPLPSARVQADGRFSLRAVPPGQYTLIARGQTTVRTEMPSASAAPGGLARPPQAMQTIQTISMGRAIVSVDGQPVSGVVISLDAGHALSGRVTFEGGTPPDLTRARLSATLQPVQTPIQLNMPSPSAALIGPDGTFKFTGIAPGRYTLRANGFQGWSMKSSTVGGRDALDFPFDVEDEDISGAMVTMAYQQPPAELSGFLTDQQGKPATDYTIVVFSSDQRFWTPGSRRIVTARPGTDGKYLLRGLPPGDYQIAALSDLEPGTQYDPELLKMLLAASTRVTLDEGAKLTQDLRINNR